MKKYLATLPAGTLYLECHESAELVARLKALGIEKLAYFDTTDHKLEAEIQNLPFEVKCIETPQFLCSRALLQAEKPSSSSQASFYEWQRKRLKLLLVEGNKPQGGNWSLDSENRKKLPAGEGAKLTYPRSELDADVEEGKAYVQKQFPSNPGSMNSFDHITFDRSGALEVLFIFLDERLVHFGDYEDFTAQKHQFLFHAMISPYLNNGLLTPAEVIDEATRVEGIALNNLEGFVRQVIGWREYMRHIYLVDNERLINNNPFSYKRKLTEKWYTGDTGIKPVDDCILDGFEYGYLHHIRRLMYVGQMMLLCQVHPDEMMRWFSEFACDSYDWVMVGNVYGMICYDKKMISKPYISSSNYILKNSDYKKDGDWDIKWTALYYNFLHRNQEEIKGRGSLMLGNYRKLGEEKLEEHLRVAKEFIERVTSE